MLPLHGMRVVAQAKDCQPLREITNLPHVPCDTYALIAMNGHTQAVTAAEVLRELERQLRGAGWHGYTFPDIERGLHGWKRRGPLVCAQIGTVTDGARGQHDYYRKADITSHNPDFDRQADAAAASGKPYVWAVLDPGRDCG